jgi:hypothetical protein
LFAIVKSGFCILQHFLKIVVDPIHWPLGHLTWKICARNTILYTPYHVGITVCAVSKFVYTRSFFWRGRVIWFFLYEKGSKGKKVLLQDM